MEVLTTSISLKTAASKLQISPATLRNWVKLGFVEAKSSDQGLFFQDKHISELKQRLSDGSLLRLRKRANKNQNSSTHRHDELLDCKQSKKKIDWIIKSSSSEAFPILNRFYVASLIASELLSIETLKNNQIPDQLKHELAAWNCNISSKDYLSFYQKCRDEQLDFSQNIMGYAYQALCSVGDKQKSGAYYTPPSVVTKVIADSLKQDATFLDPCCGSGSFIMAAYEQLRRLGVSEPHLKVYGLDLDRVAVLVSRANLTLATRGKANSVDQIRQANALMDTPFEFELDVIATNPPWGSLLSSEDLLELRDRYPEVKSKDSFSYFICASLRKLKKSGTLHFILPESILNVKAHRDIRNHIIKHFTLESVTNLSEKFSGVFTKAIALKIKKERYSKAAKININTTSVPYSVILSDPDRKIPIAASKMDQQILNCLERGPRIYLKGASDFALGIVTGDNERFLQRQESENCEPILRGADIFRFHIQGANTFIKHSPKEWQQVAPLWKYRVSEKIVYRFICKELVFAIDRSSRLTLNSANVLSPRLPNYSLLAICGILNSKLAQIYYQRKFNSIKTLRGNLEKFPFPRVRRSDLSVIEEYSKNLESGFNSKTFDLLNEAVMDLYRVDKKLRPIVHQHPLSPSFDFSPE